MHVKGVRTALQSLMLYPLIFGIPSCRLLFMDKQRRVTVERAIGREIGRRREAAKITQSEVAMYARQLFLPWTRATIAAIELGRKELTLAELAVMLLVLKEAGISSTRLSLGDLIPPDDRPVHLWPGVQLSLRDARTLLLGGDDTREIRPVNVGVDIRDFQACDPTEQKAAATLRVPPRAIVDAAYDLWDHSLSRERLQRLQGSSAASGATERRLQALKGHVTRQLLDELRPRLKKSKRRKPR
jgi:transcriptional regulator with XRE-family HTH domain